MDVHEWRCCFSAKKPNKKNFSTSFYVCGQMKVHGKQVCVDAHEKSPPSLMMWEKCRGAEHGCFGCEDCKHLKTTTPASPVSTNTNFDWPFDEDDDTCSTHPSAIMCLHREVKNQSLPMNTIIPPHSSIYSSLAVALSPKVSANESIICGLINEYGVACNRIRNPQSETRTADGNIRCRGCNMIRTPLLRVQNDIQAPGK